MIASRVHVCLKTWALFSKHDDSYSTFDRAIHWGYYSLYNAALLPRDLLTGALRDRFIRAIGGDPEDPTYTAKHDKLSRFWEAIRPFGREELSQERYRTRLVVREEVVTKLAGCCAVAATLVDPPLRWLGHTLYVFRQVRNVSDYQELLVANIGLDTFQAGHDPLTQYVNRLRISVPAASSLALFFAIEHIPTISPEPLLVACHARHMIQELFTLETALAREALLTDELSRTLADARAAIEPRTNGLEEQHSAFRLFQAGTRLDDDMRAAIVTKLSKPLAARAVGVPSDDPRTMIRQLWKS